MDGTSVANNIAKVLSQSQPGKNPGQNEFSRLADLQVTRAAAAAVLGRVLNWPKSGDAPLTFSDAENIPAAWRQVVAEARARGILRGYPDGSFLPMSSLTRAEAAVALDAVLRNLGLEGQVAVGSYPGSDKIPAWAASAVADTSALGLLSSRVDGTFASSDPITAGEMAEALERLLTYCQVLLQH
jgi:hypothetical protein